VHASLDGRHIGVREGTRSDHVVEEAEARILEQGRANAQLRSREEIEHRRGQEVRGRMAEHVEARERCRQDGLDFNGAVAVLVR